MLTGSTSRRSSQSPVDSECNNNIFPLLYLDSFIIFLCVGLSKRSSSCSPLLFNGNEEDLSNYVPSPSQGKQPYIF